MGYCTVFPIIMLALCAGKRFSPTASADSADGIGHELRYIEMSCQILGSEIFARLLEKPGLRDLSHPH